VEQRGRAGAPSPRFHRDLEQRRAELDLEIDGIVVKLDDLAGRARLGATARYPRWALAWKFAPRGSEAVVQDLRFQIGRSGVLTPVAVLSPVELGGATITRATLHSRGELVRRDLRAGDTVRVVRAGDVIPEVVERVVQHGRRRGPPVRLPRRCPACRTPLVRKGPVDLCPNQIGCPAQLRAALRHLASRRALDLRGLGPVAAERLVASELVKTLSDLFALRADALRAAGFGSAAADQLAQAIRRARRTELHRFLYALGIPGVGVRVRAARALAAHAGTLGALAAADEDDLRPVVGPATAARVTAFFRATSTRRLIARSLEHGVEIVRTGRDRPPPASVAQHVQ